MDIPFPLISASSEFLWKPLHVLFNKITESGQITTIWKQGFVTSLKKKSRKPGFEGFCSISLTLIFWKVYKGFLADWKKSYLFPLRQSRNLKSTSTSHYLVTLINNIGKILEKPYSWLNLISIDLWKAIELVIYNILVEKLVSNFNIDPLLVKLVASFLTNRSQVVKYQNHYSNPLPFQNGISPPKVLSWVPFFFQSWLTALQWNFLTDGNLLMTWWLLKHASEI